MGRGRRRGPKQLSFRALLDGLAQAADRIGDLRQAAKVSYPLQDYYRSGLALFFLQDPSLLEFQRRFQEQIQSNNLTAVFGVESIPSDTQLREVLDTHDYAPLLEVYSDYFRRLQRSKQLDRYQFYQGYYLITLDGSQYFRRSPTATRSTTIRCFNQRWFIPICGRSYHLPLSLFAYKTAVASRIVRQMQASER